MLMNNPNIQTHEIEITQNVTEEPAISIEYIAITVFILPLMVWPHLSRLHISPTGQGRFQFLLPHLL